MLRLSNISIGIKLGIMSGLGILLVVGMIVSQIWGNSSVRSGTELAAFQQQIAQDSMTVAALEVRMQLGVRDVRLARAPENLQRALNNIDESLKAATPVIDATISKLRVPENRERMQKVKSLAEQYASGARELAAMQSEIIKISGSGAADAAARIAELTDRRERFARERTLPIAAQLDELTEKVRGIASSLAEKEIAAAAQQMTSAERVGLVIGFIAGAILLGSAVFGAMAIARPLRRLVPELEKLALGDFNMSMPWVGRRDEIGQIAAAAERVADRVGATIANIKVAAREVTNASAEISTSTTDLSQRTEEQAASLEETSASMEEMTATVKKNAENAQQANQFASGTREVADRGGEVVAKAVDAMARIEESSRKIADIIGVIDEIARQTNLLALNAAVEAARAGEAGRGFAVVASEVRSLAQRSSQAAKDIKDLITSSSAQVKDGVDLVNRAGGSLSEIVESIKKVTDIVRDIANASIEQSTGIEQINKALTQMDEVTQQNSALVEENAATAKTLEHQAAAMDERVAFFRLREGAASAETQRPAGAEERQATVTPAPRQAAGAPKATTAAPKRPTAAPKRVAAGGAVGRMHTALASAIKEDPDWKEF